MEAIDMANKFLTDEQLREALRLTNSLVRGIYLDEHSRASTSTVVLYYILRRMEAENQN